jgi:NADH-quinone oxidoreductase subunit J
MTIYSILFYILSAVIVVSTGLAITRRNLVHAVIYLVVSFFGSAMLFYLLGAPLLAALEVIIYAGAIMILFLFIIMMLRVEGVENNIFPTSQLLPAVIISGVYLIAGALMLFSAGPGAGKPLEAAVAEPVRFGVHLFQRHWLAIEIASLLLLVALVGALYLGRDMKRASNAEREGAR